STLLGTTVTLRAWRRAYSARKALAATTLRLSRHSTRVLPGNFSQAKRRLASLACRTKIPSSKSKTRGGPVQESRPPINARAQQAGGTMDHDGVEAPGASDGGQPAREGSEQPHGLPRGPARGVERPEEGRVDERGQLQLDALVLQVRLPLLEAEALAGCQAEGIRHQAEDAQRSLRVHPWPFGHPAASDW